MNTGPCGCGSAVATHLNPAPPASTARSTAQTEFRRPPQCRARRSRLTAFALDRTNASMDFADSLHLGQAVSCDAFLTVNQRFVRSAKATGLAKVRLPQNRQSHR